MVYVWPGLACPTCITLHFWTLKAMLGMTTLEERRHQADMLYVYKILTGRENVDRSEWFTMAAEASRATRSTAHGLNIRVKHSRLEVRRNFFSVRVSA